MKTRMIFIRHGESDGNIGHYFTGNLDVPLTDKGRAQAKCAADALKDTPIDAAYASDLIRAFETGEIIAAPHGIRVIPDKGLREINGGEWEGVRFDDLDERFHEGYQTWRGDMANCRCTGGESVRELAARVKKACEAIAAREEGRTVLIATHATPIRAMQLLWQGLPVDEIGNIPWVMNASISIADFEAGVWTPIVIGSADHLAGLRTNLPGNI